MALDRRGFIDVPWTSQVPGLLGPMMAALATTWLIAGRDGMKDLLARMVRWRVGWDWFLFAAMSPIVLFGLAVLFLALSGSELPTVASLGEFSGLPSAGAAGIWILLVLLNGFGEETGWRGYLQEQLQDRFRPLEATAAVAAIWACWHLPVFFFHDNFVNMTPATVVGWVFGLLIGGAVVFAWLYNRTSGSILMVALWHGSYNWAVSTAGSSGFIAALVSTVVMAGGLIILGAELRARHRDKSASVIAAS
jgi:membrane protease YdiL (CAAX protease family)